MLTLGLWVKKGETIKDACNRYGMGRVRLKPGMLQTQTADYFPDDLIAHAKYAAVQDNQIADDHYVINFTGYEVR